MTLQSELTIVCVCVCASLQGQAHLQHGMCRYAPPRPVLSSFPLPALTQGDPDENAKMTDCYFEKKDWRACKDEVSEPPPLPPWAPGATRTDPADDGVDGAKLELFNACWKRHNNDQRTSTKDE